MFEHANFLKALTIRGMRSHHLELPCVDSHADGSAVAVGCLRQALYLHEVIAQADNFVRINHGNPAWVNQ